jgi:hypothetical protein
VIRKPAKNHKPNRRRDGGRWRGSLAGGVTFDIGELFDPETLTRSQMNTDDKPACWECQTFWPKGISCDRLATGFYGRKTDASAAQIGKFVDP